MALNDLIEQLRANRLSEVSQKKTYKKESRRAVKPEVQAQEASGGHKFVFQVINTADKLLPLSFRSAQTYDFEVVDAATGLEVWRWSRRMFFTQVIRQESIRPNRNWVFEVMWNHRDNDLNVVMPGNYKVIATLTTQPLLQSEPAAFEIK